MFTLPKVSIILPSIREYDVKRSIQEIQEAEPELDYEIIVVSPFFISGYRVVWISERSPLNSKAYDVAYKYSVGNYIATWSDHVSPSYNFLTNSLNKLSLEDKFTAGDFGTSPPSRCSVYSLPYARWGIYPRMLLENVGGLLDLRFKKDWADPDLGLRIHVFGGRIIPLNTNISVRPPKSYGPQRPTFINDTNEFLDKWHGFFGTGISRELVFNCLACINVCT